MKQNHKRLRGVQDRAAKSIKKLPAWLRKLGENTRITSRSSHRRILDKAQLLIDLTELNRYARHTEHCNIHGNPLSGDCICGLLALRHRITTYSNPV